MTAQKDKWNVIVWRRGFMINTVRIIGGSLSVNVRKPDCFPDTDLSQIRILLRSESTSGVRHLWTRGLRPRHFRHRRRRSEECDMNNLNKD